ncbi:acetate/propionate family kinase [Candidatus Parcubacteria bacterium]|nr:MAG: acetate/propionate family kinase [Candidatus Parcubacteria bacterium]
MNKKKFILVVNSGSSTIKFKIYDNDGFNTVLCGNFERIGLDNSFYNIEETSSKRIIFKNFPAGIKNHEQALRVIVNLIGHWRNKIYGIGHRIVHGGEKFTKSTVLNQKKILRIEKYNELAPLHNPINLSCAKICLENFRPTVKNVGVFDTAFFKTLPDYAYLYPIPYEYYADLKIRRYGFHGISHEYAAETAAEKINLPLGRLRVITCHLGSGSSVTAIKKGRAVATSMGFTPLEGLMMGTRCGDIDPAISLFLQRRINLDVDKVDDLLNKKSGLLGIFKYSSDMRDILVASGYKVTGYRCSKKFSNKETVMAKLALKMFVYNVRRYIGSYAAILGGVDVVVFTGGIGQNSTIRKLIMSGLKLNSKYKIVAVKANEELKIAKEVFKTLKKGMC